MFYMTSKPFSMKVERKEIELYKKYADTLGLPLSGFVKLVLKLYAGKVFNDLKKNQMTNVSKN